MKMIIRIDGPKHYRPMASLIVFIAALLISSAVTASAQDNPKFPSRALQTENDMIDRENERYNQAEANIDKIQRLVTKEAEVTALLGKPDESVILNNGNRMLKYAFTYAVDYNLSDPSGGSSSHKLFVVIIINKLGVVEDIRKGASNIF